MKVPVRVMITNTRFEVLLKGEIITVGQSMPEVRKNIEAINKTAFLQKVKGKRTPQYEIEGQIIEGRIGRVTRNAVKKRTSSMHEYIALDVAK